MQTYSMMKSFFSRLSRAKRPHPATVLGPMSTRAGRASCRDMLRQSSADVGSRASDDSMEDDDDDEAAAVAAAAGGGCGSDGDDDDDGPAAASTSSFGCFGCFGCCCSSEEGPPRPLPPRKDTPPRTSQPLQGT